MPRYLKKPTHKSTIPIEMDAIVVPQPTVRRMVAKQRGTYALLFKSPVPFHVVVGKLGPALLNSGYWIYVGSAFGPGGLRSRLSHHLKPSCRPHWHLDYIKNAMHPVEIWTTTDSIKREHDWATILSGLNGATRPISGFGASDCMCCSHLIHLHQRPGFSCFKKRAHSAIPAHGPLFRLDLKKQPYRKPAAAGKMA